MGTWSSSIRSHSTMSCAVEDFPSEISSTASSCGSIACAAESPSSGGMSMIVTSGASRSPIPLSARIESGASSSSAAKATAVSFSATASVLPTRTIWLAAGRAFGLPTVPLVHDEREVRRWMGDDIVGRTDMWVAEVDGVITGLMVLDHGRDGAGWIEHLYLDPSWMGRGLGDRFVELAKERLPGGIQLWTFQVNDPARRFYARHGFAEAELTDGKGNEERAPDVRMEWTPAAT